MLGSITLLGECIYLHMCTLNLPYYLLLICNWCSSGALYNGEAVTSPSTVVTRFCRDIFDDIWSTKLDIEFVLTSHK